MSEVRTGHVDADGATLYYEVRGSGPAVLLICGGVYDAQAFYPLAEALAAKHTVISYDRRGNSRSPFTQGGDPQRIETHAEDALLVVDAVLGDRVDGREVHVFGNSSGATIGLQLAVQEPSLVRTVVAHEPPLFSLLEDPEYWTRLTADVERAFEQEGPQAAMSLFYAGMTARTTKRRGDGVQGDVEAATPQAMDPQTAAMMERMQQNFVTFIGFEVPRFSVFELDVLALQASDAVLVPAVGADSEGEPAHEAGRALARKLGVDPLVLPGDHGGFGSHAAEFATELIPIFGVDRSS